MARTMDDYRGRHALVTGAAQGIGRAIAEELHGRGARLALLDCKAEKLRAFAAELNRKRKQSATAHAVELSSAEAIAGFARDFAAAGETLHLLVNNAGRELDLPLDQLSGTEYDLILAVNLRAPFLLVQGLLNAFSPEGGAVVNVSSIHATHAFPNAIPYAASKAGLNAMTRNLALELAPRKIRVNAVAPGYIDTAMWEEWLASAADPDKLARETAALHPLGRRGLPEDVARAVAYLGSEECTWITGTVLVVDGGLTIRAHS